MPVSLPSSAHLAQPAKNTKGIRSAADHILSILKTHHFSDRSMTCLIDALMKHGLGGASHSKVIATLCGHLKTNIRWHAAASQAAAFQMMLGARVSEEFYRDWEATSAKIECWSTFYADLYVRGVVSVYNVWHAALHVARRFNSPSHLTAIVVALERCKEHHPSEPFLSSVAQLADKVLMRLKDLGVYCESHSQEKSSLGMYEGVIERIGSLDVGGESSLGSRGCKSIEREPNEGPTSAVGVLERVVVDMKLALESRENEKIGKSKAKV